MAEIKISALTTAPSTITSADVVPIVQGGTTYKVSAHRLGAIDGNKGALTVSGAAWALNTAAVASVAVIGAGGTPSTATFLRGDFTWGSAGGTGTGVTDGNKGDISVASGGADWTINSGAVTSGKLATAAVGVTAIGTGAVGTTALADGAITSAKYGAGSVDTTALKTGAVTSAKLAAGAVDTTAMKDGSITSAKFAANAVDSTALAIGAVISNRIATAAVTTTALGTGAVTSTAHATGGVTTTAIATGAVTYAKLSGFAEANMSANTMLVGVASGSTPVAHAPATVRSTLGLARVVFGWGEDTVSAGTYDLPVASPFSYVINQINHICRAGSMNVTIVVSGVNATALTSIVIAASTMTTVCAACTVSAGAVVRVAYASVSSASKYSIVVWGTRL